MLTRRVRAIEFAESLAESVRTEHWARMLRSADECTEHKVLAPYVDAHLSDFLRRGGKNPEDRLFDWEGNSPRTWSQSHSYDLLGTSAHPDAAVLRPFSCAIEFDRQAPTKGPSYLKDRMMKASCHVLSGAYEAALFVYILNRPGETSAEYLESDAFTMHLLASLRAHGLIVAVLDPA